MKTPDMLTTKQQIHNALEQLLVLFVKNNEYGDVDGLLDDTPFMPLFISLKKSVYEKLLTLAMQNEEIEEEELAALQEKTNIIWKGNAFSFPPLSAFATKEHIFRFCNFDLERFHQYLSDIEDTLLCTSYSQAIELIYSRMSMEGGVGLADTIRQNKIEHEKKNQAENRNEFDNDVSTDGIDYAIHWEDDNNYWTIDIWSFVYGKAVYYFHNQELADKYGYMLEFPNGEKQLWQKGIAGYKDIEVKIPRLLEDISRAFYESKCTFEHGYTDYPEIEQAALARYIIDKDIAMVERSETGKTRTIAKEPVEGDVGHTYILRYLVHPNEIERLAAEEKTVREALAANGQVPIDDGDLWYADIPKVKEKDRPIGKGMFKTLLASDEDGRGLSKEGDKILLGYMLFLETVLEILKMPNFQIPEEIIEEIVDVVAFRVKKVATLNTINFYTRKSKGKLKKGDLQAMITPRSRWRSCSDYYSDEMFTVEDLDKFADYLGVVID